LTRLANTRSGIARVGSDEVELLDVPWTELGAALQNIDAAELASAPARAQAPLASTTFLSPIIRPGKVIVIGMNFRSHIAEGGREPPEKPVFAIAAASAVTGPNDEIVLPPRAPDMVDYEGEIAVVIGRLATNVSPEQAWDHVAGLTVCNDVGARDLAIAALKAPELDLALSKSFDTFKPLGPWLVTADEFTPDVDLRIQTWVNDELRQDERSGQFIFSIPQLISHVSSFVSLEAGDVITTGTPSGVGHGKGIYLKSGDRIRIEVERIGALENVIR
jgi:2-keto-4-pentenoate hydratase/2-oxohepta-3-ene-1,7-dioic acid hydratase in catechol pathway